MRKLGSGAVAEILIPGRYLSLLGFSCKAGINRGARSLPSRLIVTWLSL